MSTWKDGNSTDESMARETMGITSETLLWRPERKSR